MLNKTRSFFMDLHEDESGPTTVEWILLIVVAVVIIIAIFLFVGYLKGKAGSAQDKFDSASDSAEGGSN